MVNFIDILRLSVGLFILFVNMVIVVESSKTPTGAFASSFQTCLTLFSAGFNANTFLSFIMVSTYTTIPTNKSGLKILLFISYM